MVNSILGKAKEINYPEIKILDPEDKNFDASMYEIMVLGKDIIIALGQAKYTFIDDNIIYFPIYFVKDGSFSTQIGVYEIIADQLPNVIDEDGDVILDDIDNPLLYSYVTPEMLTTENKKSSEKKQEVEEVEEKIPIKDTDSDEIEIVEIISPQEEANTLPEQTDAQVDKEQAEYKKEKGQPWVQEFFHSNEYNLIDNEGGGDCLFATIRDALKSVDKDVSVMELRSKLSEQVTPEIYEQYKNHYDMFATTIVEGNAELKRLNKMNIELRDRLKNSKERNEQKQIVEQAKIVADKYKTLKNELKTSKEMLHEFRFMKKVHSVEDLKKIIKTNEYWGDTWAISTLERVLNIKLVLFSSEEWKEGSRHNVLNCGQLNDTILEDEGNFEPQYYILLDYTGDHYKLITYKYHKIFTFSELPYVIKLDVSKNCLQGTSGPYNIIPQFKSFNDNLGVELPIELNVDEIVSTPNELYTDDIVFQIYNRANNKPLPGKGNGEKIPLEKISDFSKLKNIDNWRRKLDDDYISPFELDGHKWKTVEHYYQANKFKNTNKEFYLLFSLDSESKISNSVDLAKAAGSKSGKHKGDLLRNKDIKIDPEFYGGNEDVVLQNALYAKFDQDNTDLLEALLETKNAKLQHYKAGIEPKIENSLMIIRNKFKNKLKHK
jgi:predicted NAD-dependent protein-ADP-ribosyltransferase YbiA (DUF1768 family)